LLISGVINALAMIIPSLTPTTHRHQWSIVMRMNDHDSRQDCRVIPFVKPVTNEDNVVTSSIAAVIAVTILHHEGESPEERLLEIIEASGEAEVLDIADVLEEFEALGNAPMPFDKPANDNQYFIGI
jgi:hypothetical protein